MGNIISKLIENHLYANPPLWYDMIVTMNLKIKKGEDSGHVHIPCAFETLTHSIDFNPSLIKKKGREFINFFNPKEKWKFVEDKREENYYINKTKKKVIYNPDKFMIEMSKAEKKTGYYLDEIERCSHCGQKTVISEIQETQYRSCPIIDVRLSDKAKEDLIIPIKFGVARAQFYKGWIGFILILCGYLYLFNITLIKGQYGYFMLILALSWIMFFYTIRVTKLLIWYIEHRSNAEIMPKQPFFVSLLQQAGIL